MDLSGSRRQRARKLSRKIASSPVLPVLGITKAVIDLSLPAPKDGVDVPWNQARHRAFLTGYTPSNRTQSALEAVGLEY
jgi:hypothetical protein